MNDSEIKLLFRQSSKSITRCEKSIEKHYDYFLEELGKTNKKNEQNYIMIMTHARVTAVTITIFVYLFGADFLKMTG